ncbi:FHA domain-containing protein [bacterium]|nr:FHA domain-containing protein [bacterium]
MTMQSNTLLVRLLGTIKVCILALLVLTPSGIRAVVYAQNSAIPLQDAIAQDLVEITRIVGNRTDAERDLYAQPMLLMGLRNKTPNELILELPVGSRFRALGQGSDLLGTGFARPMLTLEAGATNESVGVIAYQLDVAPFVDNTQNFEYTGITPDNTELAAVNTLHTAGSFSGSDIVPQLALWRIISGDDCEQLDAKLGPILGTTLGCSGELAQRTQLLVEQALGPTDSGGSTEPDSSPPVDSSLFILAIIVVPIILIVMGVLLSRKGPATSEAAPATGPEPVSQQPSAKRSSSQPLGGLDERITDSSRGLRGNILTAPLPQPPAPPSPQEAQPQPNPVQDPPAAPKRQAVETEPAPQSRKHAVLTEPAAPQPRRQAVGTEGYDPPTTPRDIIRELPKDLTEPKLELHNAPNGTRPIVISGEIVLTRDAVYQTELDDPTISAPHCFIRLVDGQWHIRDLNSRNGTSVEHERIPPATKAYPLQSGNVITLGKIELIFSADTESEQARLTTRDRSRTYTNNPEVSPYWLITNRKLQFMTIEDRTLSVPHAVISFEGGWKVRGLNTTQAITLERRGRSPLVLQDKPVLLQTDDQIHLSAKIGYTCKQPNLPQIDTYQLRAWAGKGGLASVFLANHDQQPDDYVMKLIRTQTQDTNQAFRIECELLHELSDIARITPYVTHAEHETYGPYLVQKYIDGATLGAVMRLRQAPLDVGTAIAITLEVCDTLESLHRHGHIHCDIKPDNILLSRDGQVYLADFGAATRQGERIRFHTPDYFDPNSDGTALPQLDIYSLALVLYEMVGSTPPQTVNNAAAIEKRQAVNQTVPHGVSEAQSTTLERVIATALQTNPTTTATKTIADLRQQLEAKRPAEPTTQLVKKLLADLL